jgi:Trypsin-co-occurring domain 1
MPFSKLLKGGHTAVQPADRTFLNATLPNGTAVKIEVINTGSAQDVALLQAVNMSGVESTIAGFAEIARKASAKASPDSMEFEFGLNLGLESGKLISILAHARSEASLTVRLSWYRQAKQSGDSERNDDQSRS